MNEVKPLDQFALFERARSFWPARIELDDPSALYVLYERNEKAAEGDGELLQLAMWAFHQALHRYAENVRRQGCLTISPERVTFDEFDRSMRLNLADGSWSAERVQWEQSTIRRER
ncbi:hypothetical protein [Sphingomonas sp. SAFR-052]|uniref:hypothetical protein n=1 Tax=Sphingomonas sp. SAFR-052 TaxID=3436867 RepID=UPI003F7DBDC7